MKFNIKASNFELTPEVKEYAGKVLGYLEKFIKPGLDEDAVICDLEVEKMVGDQRKGDIFRAEVNLAVEGDFFRAEEKGESIFAAIDSVKDQIARELKRGKDRQLTLIRRGARSIKKALGLSSHSRFNDNSKFKKAE